MKPPGKCRGLVAPSVSVSARQNGMHRVVEHFSREGDENLSERVPKTATLFAISETKYVDEMCC